MIGTAAKTLSALFKTTRGNVAQGYKAALASANAHKVTVAPLEKLRMAGSLSRTEVKNAWGALGPEKQEMLKNVGKIFGAGTATGVVASNIA